MSRFEMKGIELKMKNFNCPFLIYDDWCDSYDTPCLIMQGFCCDVHKEIQKRDERITKLEEENKRLRKALPVWHTGNEDPEIIGENILLEVKSGGYRTGEFAGIHPLGYIRYNDFQGKTRIIAKDSISRWAYVKDLKGDGK